jgi:hypothetical protein
MDSMFFHVNQVGVAELRAVAGRMDFPGNRSVEGNPDSRRCYACHRAARRGATAKR